MSDIMEMLENLEKIVDEAIEFRKSQSEISKQKNKENNKIFPEIIKEE